MRVMVVYAHPVETSFNAAIYGVVIETLRKRGHDVDACDLYAENFPAIMSREDRLLYHAIPANRALAAPWIERLEAADALVLVFPTWVFAPPAILKGFCEKVFLPGVAFDLVDGKVRGVAAASQAGGRRVDLWRHALARLPGRRSAAQALHAHAARLCRDPACRSRSWAATT